MEDKKNNTPLSLSFPSPENAVYDEEKQSPGSDSPAKTGRRKPGGWRAMPYVLGDLSFFYFFLFTIMLYLYGPQLFN